MRKVWAIAVSGLLRTARDKKALIAALVMPMVLIVILGSALSGMLSSGKINPFTVYVLNQDAAAKPQVPPGVQVDAIFLGKTLIDDVLSSEQGKKLMKLEQATDLQQAKDDVAKGKASALVYIPANFSADVLAGKKPQVQLFSDPGKTAHREILQNFVGAFTEQVSTQTLAAKLGGPAPKELPKVVQTTAGAKDVGAMQYYAAAMAVMFTVMNAMSRAREIVKERKDGTLARMMVSPTGKAAVFAGQVLGSVLMLLAQFVVLMIGTRLIYGVSWGNWAGSLLIAVAFSIAAAGISTFAASAMNDEKAVDAASGLVGTLFAALSGGMFPLYGFPDAMKMVAKIIPNYWATQGFLDQMAGLGISTAILPIVLLTSMGVVMSAIGTWRLSAR